MKIATILGTRPEIIRLSRIIPALDHYAEHILIYTGQNFDTKLSTLFFDELGVRKPNYNLNAKGETAGKLISEIIEKTEAVLLHEKPDRVLILGDTNSGLAAIVAKRLGIKVYHMEAGNRCFDDRVPEEINRRIIDHSSDVLLPYTHRSKENLVHEGIALPRILVTGNPIFEVLEFYKDDINQSTILQKLQLSPNNYFLVTLHRSENVDNPDRLAGFMQGLINITKNFELPMIVSLHPRTKHKLEQIQISLPETIMMHEPFGLFDFVKLEQKARLVLSDSGTVQEECCIFGIPTVTLRDVTERPETVECGSNILSGVDTDTMLLASKRMMQTSKSWNPPVEYIVPRVSDAVSNILLGFA